MVLFNHATREMTAKIVYYGPGLCGKTTNLMVIFDKLDPKSKGKMLSLATKTDRTLFFDLLPVEIGKVGPFNLKIQLYTVPGQVFYNETRKLVLKGADSVVFVADSQPAMVGATRESFENLLENMEQNNIDPNDTPIVIQFNKRDLPGVLPVEQLQEQLGFEGYPYTEASAILGEGVMETFSLVSKITAKHLLNRLRGKSEGVEKKQSGAVKIAPKPQAEAEPEPEPVAAAPEMNPFADSVPFPQSDTTPVESSYDEAHEVSLEDLLAEGRERPATIAGNVAVPIIEPVEDHGEEVEELGAEEMVPAAEEPQVAVAVMADPAAPEPVAASASQTSDDLADKIDQLQRQHRDTLHSLLREIDALASRVRRELES